MKKLKFFTASMLFAATMFLACDPKENNPNDGGGNTPTYSRFVSRVDYAVTGAEGGRNEKRSYIFKYNTQNRIKEFEIATGNDGDSYLFTFSYEIADEVRIYSKNAYDGNQYLEFNLELNKAGYIKTIPMSDDYRNKDVKFVYENDRLMQTVFTESYDTQKGKDEDIRKYNYVWNSGDFSHYQCENCTTATAPITHYSTETNDKLNIDVNAFFHEMIDVDNYGNPNEMLLMLFNFLGKRSAHYTLEGPSWKPNCDYPAGSTSYEFSQHNTLVYEFDTESFIKKITERVDWQGSDGTQGQRVTTYSFQYKE